MGSLDVFPNAQRDADAYVASQPMPSPNFMRELANQRARESALILAAVVVAALLLALYWSRRRAIHRFLYAVFVETAAAIWRLARQVRADIAKRV